MEDMVMHPAPLVVMDYVGPALGARVFVAVVSLVAEPTRRTLNAIIPCWRERCVLAERLQEATDRDTVLGLVQCRTGIAWVTESTRWHCPKSIVLLPVVDMHVRLPFNVIWKKNNSSPVLQKFLAQVQGSRFASYRYEGV